MSAQRQAENAESQNRTGDTAIFSRVLYQLSYLGPNVLAQLLEYAISRERPYFNHMWMACQAHFHCQIGV